ncbi:glycoside hydrolase domain-containing protein [Holdemanella sp.]|uniref:glycoside hydrolase domain-containing protein n=1 Tax=Holdemanella sp. TaxID=1971762 RepID=UPI00258FFF59|nr:glycoside hydrolase domain-containing protein [Holdemanella sp.]
MSEVTSGAVYSIVEASSGKALNIWGNAEVSANRNVCLWDNDFTEEETWVLLEKEKKGDDTYYKIGSMINEDYVLDCFRGESSLYNTDIALDAEVDNDDQLVCIEEVSLNKYRIRLIKDNKYLTAVTTDNGTGSGNTTTSPGNVCWMNFSESAHNIWNLIKIADPDVVSDKNKDRKVVQAQIWLNNTYPDYIDIKVTGKTGTVVMEALVTATQVELQRLTGSFDMSKITGYFGDSTVALFNKYVNILSTSPAASPFRNSRFTKILQHAMYCKGYACGYVSGIYGTALENGVKNVQKDAGIEATGVTDSRVFQAILKTDALVLVKDSDGNPGDPLIRYIQQKFNFKYYTEFGIIPCDGHYSRDVNKAMIYYLQRLEGLSSSQATGTFGDTTFKLLPVFSFESASNYSDFVEFLKYMLYFNGFKTGYTEVSDFNGVLDDSTKSNIASFQNKFALPSVTKVDQNLWCALLISRGNTKRDAAAFDASTQMWPEVVRVAASVDYTTVGRYLTGHAGSGAARHRKNLGRHEVFDILNNGLDLFFIYQDTGVPDISYYKAEQGVHDAETALEAARSIGVPKDAIIFFAVDVDTTGVDINNNILPYFEAINTVKTFKNSYKVGIYGTRNACIKVIDAGFAVTSFVSDMSYGYSGNMGYTLPDKWDYDQFVGSGIYSGGTKLLDIDMCAKSKNAESYKTIGRFFQGHEMHIYVNMSSNPIPVYNDIGDTIVDRVFQNEKNEPDWSKLQQVKDLVFDENISPKKGEEIVGYIGPGEYYCALAWKPEGDLNLMIRKYQYTPIYFVNNGTIAYGMISLDRDEDGYHFGLPQTATEFFHTKVEDGNVVYNSTTMIGPEEYYLLVTAKECDIISGDGSFVEKIPAGTTVARRVVNIPVSTGDGESISSYESTAGNSEKMNIFIDTYSKGEQWAPVLGYYISLHPEMGSGSSRFLK